MDEPTTSITEVAVQAFRRGYQPLPLRAQRKEPFVGGWTRLSMATEAEVRERFTGWVSEGATNLGLLLGEPSGALIDIDLDHPSALRLRDHFLPPTAMRTGRSGRRTSHMWYVVTGDIPDNRRHKMADGAMCVEVRSTGSQTVIPPSIHPTGERYIWEGEPFGGERGPTVVDGRTLATQAALLALGSVLIDNWPAKGGRHDAYLALTGGLLRLGRDIHPFWERNISVLIRALADATHDEDGPEAREREVIGSTLAKLRAGSPATGMTRLGELIGLDHVRQVRRLTQEVEMLAGWENPAARLPSGESLRQPTEPEESTDEEDGTAPVDRDPLGERVGTWQPVDLDPFLDNEVQAALPEVLERSDGMGLMYRGKVNSLYGASESAKSWIALLACQQEMVKGSRVMYVDLEDDPASTIHRLRLLGCGDDDIRPNFIYLHPEDPLQDMLRKFGQPVESKEGALNRELLRAALLKHKPSLIVVDGMTALYGMHGLNTNDASETNVITTWLTRLTGGGKTTVIVIDHTGKGAQRGAPPIGAHHKIAMVQGTALQASAVDQPMPGAVGKIDLIVFKDRPGEVRRIGVGDRPVVVARVVLDSTDPSRVIASIEPPDDHELTTDDMPEALAKASGRALQQGRKRVLIDLVLVLLTRQGVSTFKEVCDGVAASWDTDDYDPPSSAVIRDALTTLKGQGRVWQDGKTSAATYALDQA